MMNDENVFENVPVIFSYTRAQAIEDDVLVDLTEWARETGFKIPVACTSTVWDDFIVPPTGTDEVGQSKRGRAHDLLWMLYVNIQRSRSARNDQMLFKVIFLMTHERQETVTLKAICGPGDNGEPVLTVMLPGED